MKVFFYCISITHIHLALNDCNVNTSAILFTIATLIWCNDSAAPVFMFDYAMVQPLSVGVIAVLQSIRCCIDM